MANAAGQSPDAVRADPESRVNRFMRSPRRLLAEAERTYFTLL